MNTQKLRSICLWVVLALVLLFAVYYALVRADYLPTPEFMLKQPAPMPTPAATRDGRWQQALSYLGNQLPQLHVNPYFKTTEAEFQQRVTELIQDVPHLNDEQVTVGIMRLVASIGDGHTRAFSAAPPARLPLEMRWLRDGLIVIAASPEYEEAVGAKVVQIGSQPVEEVYEAAKPLIAADNDMQLLNDTPVYMSMPAILYGLDLIPDQDRVTFRFEGQDGSQFDLELQPITGDPEQPFISVYEKVGVPRPLYEQNRQAFYWVQHLSEQNAVYMQFNACREQEGQPFEAFVEDTFDLVDLSPGTRLVLDLRFNGGGDEGVITPLLTALKARPMFNEPGKLFVIIGRGTYSSALQNAITLSREHHATLVGEPTGGKPNQYGEVRHFDLPNVGIRVNYSTHYWHNYPEGDPLSLEPDVSAVVTIADLLAGRDPALEAALQP